MKEARWTLQHFAELETKALYAILCARSQVFVLEQACLYLDQDNKDQHCLHLSCWQANDLLAYARIVPPGLSYEDVSIGRVLTTENARGKGLGKILIGRAIAACQQHYPSQSIRIGAQDYLRAFYQSLGFEVASDVYDEDGIAHVDMTFTPR